MKLLTKIALHVLLLLVALGMIFPMLWMIVLSLKEYPDISSGLLKLLSTSFTLGNYKDIFSTGLFDIYFLNSLLVASAVTIGNVVFCLFVGYALARKNFKMKPVVFATILGVLIIPQHVIMIPLYRMMVDFGWLNSYYALIVPWLVSPFGVFLVRQYLVNLPADIEDAARIDGAGEFYILFRIVMPLSKPILTVLAIYTFLSNWNSFLFPFLFTNEEAFRTLPVGLTFYLGKQSIDWGHLMSGASIAAMPIVLLFLLFQKQIIKGLTSGALKE